MRTTGMRGSIAAVSAAAVMLLLLYAIVASQSGQQQNTAMLGMQAAKENSLKTENLVRLLDKSTSQVARENHEDCMLNNRSREEWQNLMQTRYNAVVAGFQNRVSGLVDCTASVSSGPTTISANRIDIAGTVSCTTTAGETEITDSRDFLFSKQTEETGGEEPICQVFDTVSGCREQPEPVICQ